MTCISNQSTPKYVALSFAAIGVVYSIDDCLLFGGIQQLTHRPYPALERIKRLARSSFEHDHKQGLQDINIYWPDMRYCYPDRIYICKIVSK